MIEILRSLGLTEEAGQCIVSKTASNFGVIKGRKKRNLKLIILVVKVLLRHPKGKR